MSTYTYLTNAILLITSLQVAAGELHGRVVCKGVRNHANAVVYIDAIPGRSFTPPKEHKKMDQKDLLFIPHVMPVLVGTSVDFLNSDAVPHNVFSPDACCEKFNLGTWARGDSRSYTFKNECVATMLCNVHPEMQAFIVVVPTPYFIVTKADGAYSIPNIPDGSYQVKVWHPKLKGVQKAVLVSGPTEVSFEVSR